VLSQPHIAIDSAALMDVSATSKSRKSVIANCQAQIVRMGNQQPDIDFVPVVKLFFDADKTLSAYAAEAREHGRIVT
jgi:hypothetical protein